MTKRCTCCGKTKPLDEFYPHSAAAPIVTSWCRTCALVAKERLT